MNLLTVIHSCIHKSKIYVITILLDDKKDVLESCDSCKNKLKKLEKFGVFKILSEEESKN